MDNDIESCWAEAGTAILKISFIISFLKLKFLKSKEIKVFFLKKSQLNIINEETTRDNRVAQAAPAIPILKV
ncbi:hypothetical protein SDC9_129122 [bioreactor metagenome]|uniref:Uncharacterized protein n=1 Tax=bioreactor metagenome TaxID=1076179 RepID=A0A645CYM5_9ZZZZ